MARGIGTRFRPHLTSIMIQFLKSLTLGALLLAATTGFAQEDTIKKRMAERFPNSPPVTSVTKAPLKGLYEVVIGSGPEIFYVDEQVNYLVRGDLIDLKSRQNLTEERMNALLAVPFNSLPLKDAIVIVRGDGKRKVAIFEDPNCGYCKKFEADLQKVNDVTVYLFLLPILGPDSTEKSKNIWCAKDKGKAWIEWMTKNDKPDSATCDTTALNRNVEFGQKNKITGTPTIFFQNGSRIPGAIPLDQFESLLKSRS